MTKAIGLPINLYPHLLGVYFCDEAKAGVFWGGLLHFAIQIWRIRLHIPTFRGFRYLFTKDAWEKIEWIDKHDA